VGEWGGRYEGTDQQWGDAFAALLQAEGLGSFFWALNPNSGDTGGDIYIYIYIYIYMYTYRYVYI